MRKINKIILHCSASNNPDQDSISAIRILHTSKKNIPITWGTYETHGKGWTDVGYHFFINSKGKIENGREIDKKGAHCLGQNDNSIGICLSGDKLEDFTQDQKLTLYRLLRSLVTIFPDVTIHGHNEFADKACPVFDVEPFKHV